MRCRGRARNGYDNVVKAIVSDWQVNGVFAAFSGTPFTVTASGTSLNTPSNQQTADLIGTFTTTGNIGAAGTWFDTTAFAQPTGVRFGNTGRNQFYGPGGYNLDFSVFRIVPDRRHQAARAPGRGRQRPEPRGLRQPAGEHHVRHVRPDHRHRGRRIVPRTQIQVGLRFSF